jgi:hypothetical protein
MKKSLFSETSQSRDCFHQRALATEVAMKLTKPTPDAHFSESHPRALSLAQRLRSVSPVRTSSSTARQAHDVSALYLLRSPESHPRAPLAQRIRSVSPVRTSSSIARQAHDVLEHEAEAEGTLKGCVRVCRLCVCVYEYTYVSMYMYICMYVR